MIHAAEASSAVPVNTMAAPYAEGASSALRVDCSCLRCMTVGVRALSLHCAEDCLPAAAEETASPAVSQMASVSVVVPQVASAACARSCHCGRVNEPAGSRSQAPYVLS